MTIFVGTCGWSYKEWVGPFYPQGIRPSIGYYSKFFNAIEIDSTYYAIPTASAFSSTLKRMPEALRVSVKIPSIITHSRNNGNDADSSEFMQNIVKPLRQLHCESPLLFTIPPWIGMEDLDRYMENISSQLDHTAWIFAEIRHFPMSDMLKASSILQKNGINMCYTDNALNELSIFSLNQRDAYIRLHGRNPEFTKHGAGMEKFLYRYQGKTLDSLIQAVKGASQRFQNIYLFFNNHPQGNAAQNGMYVSEALGASRQSTLL